MTPSAHRWTRAPSAVAEHVEGDCLILDLESGRYFGIGEVGGFIWRLLDGGRSIEEIADRVARHYEVSRERAAEDAQELVQQLSELGLLQDLAG